MTSRIATSPEPARAPRGPVPAAAAARRAERASLLVRLLLGVVAVVVAAVGLGGVPAAAQDEGDGAESSTAAVDDETLRAGADVYQSVCQSCHQPGGVGIEGQFPPLIDNPNIDDAAYVESTIRNGRTGVIVVNGVTYDGVMPAQSGLSDADIANVIAYLQSGFAAPSAPAPEVDTGPVAGTELPGLATFSIAAAFLVVAGVFTLVLGPRLVSVHDARSFPWLDAWLKTGVIVVGFIVFTVFVPSRVLETEAVRELSRPMQDLIASALWGGALVFGLWALWYAHREKRI